ncbi:hypothetical protein Pdw03_8810 [Penicillium digitatum]|uniref:Uncharacterized protein n=3 Tax=Penicillium digitatum TaxID=36651 RepID=K9GXY1_PEND2|nr:hypothetical protein PDIP_14060 [Penicillium digitatum Pd1]EKV19483.1 hypothetical protein PDIG_02800 [Penicillium digitatum PHI26]EKV20690.1 hypothetical protein PDIP_14060 [Penicillium digitatum Pd1]KAG0156767.1 hypothetical protein PDIDSM_3948 [Penicillium digitatum]QQK44909.1 hypothetical protein Pdw03_8810 [Penicillium digitatum]
MARFSLSFISIFLVLAVFTLSMPTKRDGQATTQPLSLEGTVSELMHASKLMDGLDVKDSEEKADKKAAMKEEAKNEEAKAYSKLAEKTGAVDKPTSAATPAKKLSSGNFVTPTATPTHKPTSQPNALGNLPIIGGILGGAGGGL